MKFPFLSFVDSGNDYLGTAELKNNSISSIHFETPDIEFIFKECDLEIIDNDLNIVKNLGYSEEELKLIKKYSKSGIEIFKKYPESQTVFEFGEFKFYFYSNEFYYSCKQEGIHVHVTKSELGKYNAKIWLMEDGSAKMEYSNFNSRENKILLDLVEVYREVIVNKWKDEFKGYELEFKKF